MLIAVLKIEFNLVHNERKKCAPLTPLCIRLLLDLPLPSSRPLALFVHVLDGGNKLACWVTEDDRWMGGGNARDFHGNARIFWRKLISFCPRLFNGAQIEITFSFHVATFHNTCWNLRFSTYARVGPRGVVAAGVFIHCGESTGSSVTSVCHVENERSNFYNTPPHVVNKRHCFQCVRCFLHTSQNVREVDVMRRPNSYV